MRSSKHPHLHQKCKYLQGFYVWYKVSNIFIANPTQFLKKDSIFQHHTFCEKNPYKIILKTTMSLLCTTKVLACCVNSEKKMGSRFNIEKHRKIIYLKHIIPMTTLIQFVALKCRHPF